METCLNDGTLGQYTNIVEDSTELISPVWSEGEPQIGDQLKDVRCHRECKVYIYSQSSKRVLADTNGLVNWIVKRLRSAAF